MSDLGDYIQRTATRPWAWGRIDCTMWVADWVWERSGSDPAANLRGSYDDEAGADALVAEGLVAVVDREAGLARAETAVPGDVGVVEIAGRQVAAICSETGWAFRHENGVGVIRVEPLAIWALPVAAEG